MQELDTVMRLPAVMAATGLSCSEIYARIKRSEFPQQFALGKRAVGWRQSEITAWLAARMKVRPTNQPPPKKNNQKALEAA